jgi:hypothetical protein
MYRIDNCCFAPAAIPRLTAALSKDDSLSELSPEVSSRTSEGSVLFVGVGLSKGVGNDSEMLVSDCAAFSDLAHPYLNSICSYYPD